MIMPMIKIMEAANCVTTSDFLRRAPPFVFVKSPFKTETGLNFDKKNAKIGEAFNSRLILDFNQAFDELNNLTSYSWFNDVIGKGVLKKHNSDNPYFYHCKLKDLSYTYNL